MRAFFAAPSPIANPTPNSRKPRRHPRCSLESSQETLFPRVHTSSTFGEWGLRAQVRAYLVDGHAAVFARLVAGSGIHRKLYLTILRQFYQNLAHSMVGNL